MTSERLREIARALQSGASIVWDAGELFEAANMIDYLAGVRGCDKCHDKWKLPPSRVQGAPPGVTWQERASILGARLSSFKDATRPNDQAKPPGAASCDRSA